MKVIALYLDKLNEHMERMLIKRCSEEIDVRFFNPTIGTKGDLKDADIFIDTTFKVTKNIIDAAPHLKLIQRTGIGVDMVDVAYANERRIPISVCRGFNSNAVAELTILDILSLYRRLTTLDSITKKGEWHTWTYRHESYEIMGKTVGVLGAGTIGCNVIKKSSSVWR
ncbi:NAD(P)-dependent oxidoreductase [Acerihabitans sp. KWT182]|uniref:NAD(P)-dependent oxidoreductase n=1 Tax=Acerihabitans sp. KWT182 TaxID=3157919 RepID=A0AAU7QAW0_9GAMM